MCASVKFINRPSLNFLSSLDIEEGFGEQMREQAIVLCIGLLRSILKKQKCNVNLELEEV